MNNLDYKEFYQRNLPHIQPNGATLFITFHLSGALPKQVIEKLRHEQNDLKQLLAKTRSNDQKERDAIKLQFARRRFEIIETSLDREDKGPHWLKDQSIAELVSDALRYRDGKVYRLDAYTVMSNHVHVVFAPLAIAATENQSQSRVGHSEPEYHSMASILHSLKSYTANQANSLLNRKGEFWEHESYDHYIRDSSEWRRIVDYVLNNPVKAGLVQNWQDWPWSYSQPNSAESELGSAWNKLAACSTTFCTARTSGEVL